MSRKHKKKPESEVMTVLKKIGQDIAGQMPAVDKKRLLMMNIPYVIVFYLADKLAWLYRFCVGESAIERLGVLFLNFQMAFSNPILSLHIFDTLKEYISGQASDGWGEGFEQREISVDGGELYVHLWNSDDWSIQTEKELFAPRIAKGLPELCFSTLLTTGQLICIKRGETGYYPSDWDTGDKEKNVELADQLNEEMGVTMWQRKAMEVGSMCGWDVPGADPKAYEQEPMGMTLS